MTLKGIRKKKISSRTQRKKRRKKEVSSRQFQKGNKEQDVERKDTVPPRADSVYRGRSVGRAMKIERFL